MAGFVELILLVHVDSRALKHSLWCLVLLFICLFNWPKVSVFQLKLASVGQSCNTFLVLLFERQRGGWNCCFSTLRWVYQLPLSVSLEPTCSWYSVSLSLVLSRPSPCYPWCWTFCFLLWRIFMGNALLCCYVLCITFKLFFNF